MLKKIKFISLALATICLSQTFLQANELNEDLSRKRFLSSRESCASRVNSLIHSNKVYRSLYRILHINEDSLTSLLAAVNGQPTYQVLLNYVNTIIASNPGSISPNTYRIVVTLPDGTVVIDTGKTNNTYANFQSKSINENHNSRVSILDAQTYPCGEGVETKLSSTQGVKESYVAIRLGDYLDSVGTIRLSLQIIQ